MDPSAYKEVVTRRGFKYSYFASLGNGPESSVTVLLLHGFPSTARSWCKQVLALQQAGYRVLAPDMLGYGRTDRPTEVTQYKYSEMAADLIDILDAENVDKAVAIGHDWGCMMVSRLANYYPERFLAFAFLAVGYIAPQTSLDYEAVLELTRKTFGYELYGYWDFFSEKGAHDIIHKHWDSIYGLLFPVDPALWKTDFAPLGKVKQWLLADKQSPLPSYVTQDEKDLDAKELLSGVGFAAPLNWYKVLTQNVAREDDKNVKEENAVVKQPVFFGGAKLDGICIPEVYKAQMPDSCPDLTVREYERDHWLTIDRPDELNKDLLEWIRHATAGKV